MRGRFLLEKYSPWSNRSCQGQAAPKRGHFTAAVAGCLGLSLVTLAIGTWFVSKHNFDTASRAAESNLRQASFVVESTVNHQFLQVDGALASLPALLATVGTEGGPLDAKTVSRLLRSFNFQAFAFRDIMLVRADGTIWASARPKSWSGRFPLLVASDDAVVQRGAAGVLGPIRSPITGEWVIFVTRRLSVPDLGIMVAAAEVPLPLISQQFAVVGSTPGLQVLLERKDGRLLVSQPYNELQVGQQQAVMIELNRPVVQPFAFAAPTRSHIGITRPSLYQDVIVVLTLDMNIALSDWVQDRNRLLVFMGSFAILITALALTLDIAHRQRDKVEAERSRARAMLDAAIESMSDGFVMWDRDDRLVTCNEPYRRMYEHSRPFIVPGARFEDIVRQGAKRGQYPSMGADLETFVQETVAWHDHNDGPMERELPDGRWALITERRTADGGIVGIRTDITSLKHALSDLAAANRRAYAAMQEVQEQNIILRERDRALNIQNVLFDAALNNMSQGLLMTDSNQRLIIFNNRFFGLFSIPSDRFSIGLPVDTAMAEVSKGGLMDVNVVQEMALRQRALAEARQSGSFQVSGHGGFTVSVSQRPIADGGWLATYEDVTERNRAEEQIRFAAHHDALTGLPNRVLFHARLSEMIGKIGYHEAALALLCLDLDRFKQVNDTLGHPVGDDLLIAAGRRLINCARNDAVVARLGGDEFAVAFVAQGVHEAAAAAAERIISELSAPFSLDGHTISVGASVGIAIADGTGTDADTTLKNADTALYQAKAQGRGIYRIFEADMERRLVARLALEDDLSGALSRGEFELFYQPLYDLRANRLSGFEALLRWVHPGRGFVSPLHFIRVAEETGMIRQIGAWVIQQACADALNLPPDVKIAINLSPVQFQQGDVVGVIAEALTASGLPPDRLELEITESTLLENNAATLDALLQLRAMGLRIALDDFGTGYSSLSYLRRFPFDKIKIDRSFVCEMATRQDCAAIVMSIVTLAQILDITTTAEGVETIGQLDLVRNAGCTEAQGYLFSQPMPFAEALSYVVTSHLPSATVCAARQPSHPVVECEMRGAFDGRQQPTCILERGDAALLKRN
ncbi:MAG: EAL domain-containing protein [Proteobacteria bacterium]|nr:EAL domain-containing protein [Pseudomonadota bacterium]